MIKSCTHNKVIKLIEMCKQNLPKSHLCSCDVKYSKMLGIKPPIAGSPTLNNAYQITSNVSMNYCSNSPLDKFTIMDIKTQKETDCADCKCSELLKNYEKKKKVEKSMNIMGCGVVTGVGGFLTLFSIHAGYCWFEQGHTDIAIGLGCLSIFISIATIAVLIDSRK